MKPYHRRKHTIKNNGKKTRNRQLMRRNKKGGTLELVKRVSTEIPEGDRIRQMWVDATQHHNSSKIAVSYVSDHLVWYTRTELSVLSDTWRKMIMGGIVTLSTADNVIDHLGREWFVLFVTPNNSATQLDLAALYVFKADILGQCFFFNLAKKRDEFFLSTAQRITSLPAAIRNAQIAWPRADIPKLIRRTQKLYHGMTPHKMRQLTMQTMASDIFRRLTVKDPSSFNRMQLQNPLALQTARRSKMGLMDRAFSIKYGLMREFGVAMVEGRPGRPCYVAVDPTTDNIAVSNAGSRDIQIFNCDGNPLYTIPNISNTICMIFNRTGNLMVLDNQQNVYIFNSIGTLTRGFNIQRPFAGRASSFALNPAETELVVHFGLSGYIHIFNLDGTLLRSIYTRNFDSSPGSRLHGEGSIVFDTDGNIVLTDANQRRIQVYHYASGENVRTIDMASMSRPFWLAIDPSSGNFAVVDSPAGGAPLPDIPIQVLQGDGSLVCTVGTSGRGPGQLFDTQGITFAPNGDLVVCDTGNSSIKIFSRV